MIKIYHNPRCRKSREALALLKKSSKDFEIIEYLKDIPSKDELRHIIELLGITPDNLVRKKETVWKDLYSQKSLTDEAILDAMIAHPKLIERPIVINKGKAVIARPSQLIASII